MIIPSKILEFVTEGLFSTSKLIRVQDVENKPSVMKASVLDGLIICFLSQFKS